ncbi:MAG: transcription elongation factor GreA [Alphaproteobacteria bacterium]|nr:transcription elongation factor GreA [Alphaproteobacteria bacterium]
MLKPISKEGMDTLLSELVKLRDYDRPPLMLAVQAARELGDLKENSEYQMAREKQRLIDHRIRGLEHIIKESQVIHISDLSGDVITFGATVELEDEEGKTATYQLLGDTESDIEKGKISITSPIGSALKGKKKGDFVSIRAPGGVKEFEVLSVRFV